MKKISLILALCITVITFSGAFAAVGTAQTVLDEQFAYASLEEAENWTVTAPTDASLTEAYAKIVDGKLTTKMQKNLTDRSVHSITAVTSLEENVQGAMTLSAGLGLDETDSQYKNSDVKIALIDAAGEEVISIMMHSNHGGTADTNRTWFVNTSQTGETVIMEKEMAPLYDGTIYQFRLDINKEQGKADFYLGDVRNPTIAGISCAADVSICEVKLEHIQRSYNKSFSTNSAAYFDYVKLEKTAAAEELPAEDNDPDKNESEGIANQRNLLYDDFADEDNSEWTITYPDTSNLTECAVSNEKYMLKTKMSKSLSAREVHTLSLSQSLNRNITGEAVLRAGIGLDETGSQYTNSSAMITLNDISGNAAVSVELHSNYGGTEETNAVWIVTTPQETKQVFESVYKPLYDGTTFDIKLHLKPESGAVDFYYGDLNTPALRDIKYSADGLVISEIVLEHKQNSYRSPYKSNSAALFDYVKLDANIYLDEGDVKAVNEAADKLFFRHISSESQQRVTKRLTLPTETENGCIVVWKSADESVISNSGIVFRDETVDKTVTLTATFIKGYAEKEKTFEITVPTSGRAVFREAFFEDYSKQLIGNTVTGEWTFSYPAPKSDNTDVTAVADPKNLQNTVLCHANDVTFPQSYFGFEAICNLPEKLEGNIKISFRIYLYQTNTQTQVSFFNDGAQALITLASNTDGMWYANDVSTAVKANADRWTDILIDANTFDRYFTLYIDGKNCGIYNMTENFSGNYGIQQCSLYSWNRQANYNSRFLLDDLKVEENISARAEKIANEFVPAELFQTYEGEYVNAVAADFLLPTETDGATVTWSSSNQEAVSFTDGGRAQVNKGNADQTVTITATLSYKGYEVKKEFSVTVVHNLTDAESVRYDMQSLRHAVLTTEKLDRITKEFSLVTSGNFGSTVTWDSSEVEALKILDGLAVINRGQEDAALTLTATVRCGNVSESMEFPITVLRQYPANLLENAVVFKTTSELAGNPVSNLIDGNFSTSYKTAVSSNAYETVIKLDGKKKINAFLVWAEDNAADFEIYTSTDNDFYKKVFGSQEVKNERMLCEISPVDASFVKFIITPADKAKPAEINELMALGSLLTDKESVLSDLNAISLPKSVTSNLALPTAGNNGSVISWVSSNPNVITAFGIMTKPGVDTKVTLTATAVKGTETALRKFEITVKAKSASGGGNGGGGGSSMISSAESGSGPSGGMGASAVQNVPKEENLPFSDVSGNMWSYRYVESLYRKGIVSGDGALFRPNDAIVREEFAKLLTLCADIEVEPEMLRFVDVSTDDWAYGYIAKLYAAGIVSGMSAERFGMGENITRQDAAVMICRMLEKTHSDLIAYELNFTDAAEIGEYAKTSVGKLLGTGIIGGRDDGSFAPNDYLTREETAKMMCLFISLME